MASGGAPPTSGDPRLLFEYLDDPDFTISNAANSYTMADRSQARLIWTATGAGLDKFYSAVSGPTRSALANGLAFWRFNEAAIGAKGLFAARLTLPTHVAPATAPTLPASLQRWKRFTYEAAFFRDSLPTGAFEIGLVDGSVGSALLSSVATKTGIVVKSDSAVAAGAWQLNRRNENGDPLVTAAIAGAPLRLGTIEHLKMQLVTGPIRRLVVSFNGALVVTLEDADLPVGIGLGNLFGWGPSAVAHNTVADGTFSGVVASRYACELLG